MYGTFKQYDQMLDKKVAKIIQKLTPKFYLKCHFSQYPQKSTNIWATLVRKFVSKEF